MLFSSIDEIMFMRPIIEVFVKRTHVNFNVHILQIPNTIFSFVLYVPSFVQ